MRWRGAIVPVPPDRGSKVVRETSAGRRRHRLGPHARAADHEAGKGSGQQHGRDQKCPKPSSRTRADDHSIKFGVHTASPCVFTHDVRVPADERSRGSRTSPRIPASEDECGTAFRSATGPPAARRRRRRVPSADLPPPLSRGSRAAPQPGQRSATVDGAPASSGGSRRHSCSSLSAPSFRLVAAVPREGTWEGERGNREVTLSFGPGHPTRYRLSSDRACSRAPCETTRRACAVCGTCSLPRS